MFNLKLTWLTDNFSQNESNFFICSQFRLEENFFKSVIFFKCISSFTKLKKTIHCTQRSYSKLSPLLLSNEALGTDKFGPRCSKQNAKHAPMFLQFGYSKSDIIKVWK